MQTLIKRLASNELGQTGGHQRGGILIPKHCVRFFPSLGPPPNPEATVRIDFVAMRQQTGLRIIHYEQGTRNEYRLTPVPHGALRGASPGDYLLLRENADGTYTGAVARSGEAMHDHIRRDLGGSVGRITPKDYLGGA